MPPTLLTIPCSTFDVSVVYVTPFQMDAKGRWMAQLSYKDPAIEFSDVCLLTPPLRVIDYQPETSRLRLDVGGQVMFQIKLNLFYEYLVSTFYLHQGMLGVQGRSMDEIRGMFHPLLDGGCLSVFLYPTTLVTLPDGVCRISELEAGARVECVVRFHGVTQHGSRMRLHHTVPMVTRL
jgi:hypothetical protein